MLRAAADRTPGLVLRLRAAALALVLPVSFAVAVHAQTTPSAIEWPVVREGAVAAPASSPSSEPAAAQPTNSTAVETGSVSPELPAVRSLLGSSSPPSGNKDDVAAATEYYQSGSAKTLWTDKDGLNEKARGVIKTLETAADWGLDADAFDIPSATASGSDGLAKAEITLTLSALKYARFARGGRLNPSSISRILDMSPPVKDPKTVMTELAESDAPAKYLIKQHPKHEQFERLRQALLKSRGPAEPEQPVDEALKVTIPAGKNLKKGMESEDVALLRKRLKIETGSGATATQFDQSVVDGVTAFQVEQGLAPTGSLNNATRKALNAQGAPKRSNPKQNEQRLIVNMEKWRWLPEDLGSPYVWNNIPEFQTRTIKDGKVLFQERIIVGMPEWATPTFSADMEFVIFYPSWGVPDGIKTRELLPRLQRAGGGGFFDQLFGGGGGSASVMKAYGLTAYRNGKVVDPNSINPAEIKSYSFVQPSGGQNPLGIVKFRFPNKHDVYMHDTTQKNLFAQSYRAMSHGCIRVQNPIRFAEVLLEEDRGWSSDRVRQSMGQGDITLTKKIPVHNTYFTAVVDSDGRVSTFGDLYGHDSRISSALGRAMDFDGGNARPAAMASNEPDAIPGAGEDSLAAGSETPAKQKKPKDNANKQASKKKIQPVENLSDAISGLLNN